MMIDTKLLEGLNPGSLPQGDPAQALGNLLSRKTSFTGAEAFSGLRRAPVEVGDFGGPMLGNPFSAMGAKGPMGLPIGLMGQVGQVSPVNTPQPMEMSFAQFNALRMQRGLVSGLQGADQSQQAAPPKKKKKGLFGKIGSAFKKIGKAIKGIGKSIGGMVKGAFKMLGQGLKSLMTGDFKGLLKMGVNLLKAGVESLIKAPFDMLKNGVKALATGDFGALAKVGLKAFSSRLTMPMKIMETMSSMSSMKDKM